MYEHGSIWIRIHSNHRFQRATCKCLDLVACHMYTHVCVTHTFGAWTCEYVNSCTSNSSFSTSSPVINIHMYVSRIHSKYEHASTWIRVHPTHSFQRTNCRCLDLIAYHIYIYIYHAYILKVWTCEYLNSYKPNSSYPTSCLAGVLTSSPAHHLHTFMRFTFFCNGMHVHVCICIHTHLKSYQLVYQSHSLRVIHIYFVYVSHMHPNVRIYVLWFVFSWIVTLNEIAASFFLCSIHSCVNVCTCVYWKSYTLEHIHIYMSYTCMYM